MLVASASGASCGRVGTARAVVEGKQVSREAEGKG